MSSDLQSALPNTGRNRARLLAGVVIVVVIGGLVTWGLRGPTWAELQERAGRVDVGMNRDQVVRVMGEPDRIQAWISREFEFRYVAPRLLGRNREVRIEFDTELVIRVEALPFEQIAFDSASWKRSTWRRRRCMVRDLRNRIGPGTPAKHVLALLGPPDRTRVEGLGHLAWLLEPSRALLDENDWLAIDLDSRGRVVACEIRQYDS